jgi:hypothetical protein
MGLVQWGNRRALLRLYKGDWTALPQVHDVPFIACLSAHKPVLLWDSTFIFEA